MSKSAISLLGATLLFAFPLTDLSAQVSRNCTLLSKFRSPNSSTSNDVWGYVAPNGDEYGILMTTRGTSIVDFSKPRSPVQRAFISGQSSTWRDGKVVGDFVYVVTESRGAGLQIIDMRNPKAPRLAATPFRSGAWSHSHNIGLDFDTGLLYVHGTGGSVYVLDPTNTPTSPKLLKRHFGNYIHDLAVQHGLLHAGEIWNGRYAIYDIRNLGKKFLGSVRTPRAFTHNAWLTYDDKFCATTDERSGASVAFYDIQNRASPKLMSTYRTGPSRTIPHNVYMRGYVAYMSYYTEGLRVVDFSDPRNPVEVGFYDTYLGASQGFNGAWGCFCFNPSGNVYISDRSSGIFNIKPKASPAFYGKGTKGGNGKRPLIHNFGAAWLGNKNFKIGVRDAKANSGALMLLGVKKADFNVLGFNVLVDVLTGPALLVPVRTNNKGEVLIPLPVPTDSRLNNSTLFAQFVVFEGTSFASSQGMAFELFSK